MEINYVAAQGAAFLQEAVRLMSEGKSEDVLRHALSSRLPLMFPDEPWWAKAHVTGTETLARFHELGTKKYGFVDVLVGATAIEYERNLNTFGVFEHGLYQVKQYCASLLNTGSRSDLVIGVLSDTVRWFAFRISNLKDISSVPGVTAYGPEHIELEKIDECDLSSASEMDSLRLGEFLIRYLGREGGRTLVASTLAEDLGFNSPFCHMHLNQVNELVDHAFNSDPIYAGMISKLWRDFVSYLGGEAVAGNFDKKSYVEEFYILTLAKLICANVLSNKGLISDNNELQSILDGDFFKTRGLPNLVEYDYFGWLNASPYVTDLLTIAHDIQKDLRAYDFYMGPAEDLFGSLMAQLAERSQRLLLGQEWTPNWLAEALVKSALLNIPEDQQPRFLDMCCGSGAMVIETVKGMQTRLLASGSKPGDVAALSLLTSAITAFDIDPLAVMLAKIGWVLAIKEWLVPGQETQIPVYHADSLFANTPVTKVFSASGKKTEKLLLDTEEVELPGFLIESKYQIVFDALLSRGYNMAMSSANSEETTLKDQDIERMIDAIAGDTYTLFSLEERRDVFNFCSDLLRALEVLQRAGRNGIWAFVLRNSFRPALVAGRFNGIVTNPPWLALSKIASNPYRDALKSKAAIYGIKAPGASHPHVEIATIFLLHAIDRYLTSDAVIACVLPDTVLNGAHHEPFRAAGYLSAPRPVEFMPTEIWKVSANTFKNEAIVLFGRKKKPSGSATSFHGRVVGRSSSTGTTYHVVKSGGKTAWTTFLQADLNQIKTSDSIGAMFRQGADIMPRSVIFHSAEKTGAGWNLGPITAESSLFYLRAEGKILTDFNLTATGVSDHVMFDILLSKHLAPYELAKGAKGLLPLTHGPDGWSACSGPALAALGNSTYLAIGKALKAQNDESLNNFFSKIDTDRKKLVNQGWSDQDWVVFASAGGKIPCAAFVQGRLIPSSKTIVDQTLYWGLANSEDEAIYITGLINSPAICNVISAHQPRGAFGERHIHKLPFERTPKFDSSNRKHCEVVRTTKDLLVEWSKFKQETEISKLLEPKEHLNTRRRKIRSILEGLPSWSFYKQATEEIYTNSRE